MVTSKLSLLCRNSLTKQFLVTGFPPENYDNNEVPVSLMAQDFLTTYKYGWKTSYYQNTYDVKTDLSDEEEKKQGLENLLNDIFAEQEEDCDSCKI